MKMKSTTGCLREKNGLHVCQKSSKISKNCASQVKSFQQEAQLDTCVSNKHDGNDLVVTFEIDFDGFRSISVVDFSCSLVFISSGICYNHF